MKVIEEAYNAFDEWSVNEFWRFAESQNWQLGDDCELYKRNLMKTLSPVMAKKYHNILEYFACQLGTKLSGAFPYYDAIETKTMAANAIGQGGKGEFVKLFDSPLSADIYEDSRLDIMTSFLVAIPNEDDYWQ